MKLTELRELMAKATPGKWTVYLDAQSDPWVMPDPRADHGAVCMPYNSGYEDEDAALIVAMHTMLPKLLAVAEAAKAATSEKATGYLAWSGGRTIDERAFRVLVEALIKLEDAK